VRDVLQARLPFCHLTNSVTAVKVTCHKMLTVAKETYNLQTGNPRLTIGSGPNV